MFARTPEFDTFVAPARPFPGLWRFALACCVGMITCLTLAMMVVYLLATELGFVDQMAPANLIDRLLIVAQATAIAEESADTPERMALVLAPFLAVAVGLLALMAVAGRPFGTLLGPARPVLRDMALGVALVVLIDATYGVIALLAGWERLDANPNATLWALHLLWAVPVILVQTSSEELIFRGYFAQQFAARFRSPWIWMILPSLLFAISHYDPLLATKDAWLYVAWAFFFGLMAADLTRVTGNLGAALGIHFANNAVLFLGVAYPGDLSGLAFYLSSFQAELSGFFELYGFVRLLFLWVGFRLLLIALARRRQIS